MGIAFKKMYDGKADTVSIIGITTPTSDSVFYAFNNATGITLVLNPLIEATNFSIETIFGSYTLHVGYKSTVQFVSDECGVRSTLSKLVINESTFDSIRIVNTNFANPAQLNLEFYRCPRTNQLKLSFRKLVDGVEAADTVQLTNVTADYGTPFYFPAGKISRINLPLNAAANSTTFTFEFLDGSVRTLTVQHTRTPWNEFIQCNTLMLFSKLSKTASTFSQVNLLRDSIQDPPQINFAIYK